VLERVVTSTPEWDAPSARVLPGGGGFGGGGFTGGGGFSGGVPDDDARQGSCGRREESRDQYEVIELVDVTKIYQTGSLSVAALRGVSLTISKANTSPSWPIGLGQVNAHAHLGMPRLPMPAATPGRRERQRNERDRVGSGAEPPHRLRLPTVQPPGRSLGLAKCRAPAHLCGVGRVERRKGDGIARARRPV